MQAKLLTLLKTPWPEIERYYRKNPEYLGNQLQAIGISGKAPFHELIQKLYKWWLENQKEIDNAG